MWESRTVEKQVQCRKDETCFDGALLAVAVEFVAEPMRESGHCRHEVVTEVSLSSNDMHSQPEMELKSMKFLS